MRITEQEKLIAKVFDKSVEALGLMTKSICDSIKKDKQPELTKREYFAGLAMQAILNNESGYFQSAQRVAEMAVEQADELLKELETPKAD